MKYNALRAPCDAKDNIDIRDSNHWRQKNGESGAFYLKIYDVLAQQDEFSTTLRSRLVVCKVRNERTLYL